MKLKFPSTGFTMPELLIATSLFSLLIVGVCSLFKSGGDSFNSGTWRLEKQKSAQIFLGRLKEVLEKANNAETIPANGEVVIVASPPIFINNEWLDKSAAVSDGQVVLFSIFKPYRDPQPKLNINSSEVGYWTGVVLSCTGRTLRLYRTGSLNKLPPAAPPEVGSPDLVKFPEGFNGGDIDVELNDVASLSVRVVPAAMDAGLSISVTIELQRFSGGAPTQTKVTESITSTLLHQDQEIRGF
ncbi:hypothetical protein AUK22_07830 [bacterium CG2_30_54_10]|nr:MAG: hypothetical protein AUK22_07830 [bacterium CG2_30_54_10]